MESVAIIQWCLDHLNYWTIAFLMAIESTFIPLPSEIVVPPAAYRAAGASGELNVVLVVLSASVGAIVGSLINYGIAYYFGRPVVYKLANSRFGHMCLLDEEKVHAAEKFFNRHGAIATFTGRLIPAVRQLISLPAGLAKMGMGKFLLFTVLGATIWNTVLAALGYYLASVLPEDRLMETVTRYSHEISYGIVGVVVMILLFLAYKYWKK